MNGHFLLSHRWKLLGWMLTVPALIGGIYYMTLDDQDYLVVNIPQWLQRFLWIDNSIFSSSSPTVSLALLDELICIALLSGLLLLAFSKEKKEDEWIQHVRLESFQWAILINTLLLMAFTLFAHGFPFLSVMVYNMFTPLLIFVLIFHYVLFIKPLMSKS